MTTVKLAQALLRRKELQGKVDQLKQINVQGLFEVKVKRQNVSDNVDQVTAQVPRISMEQVTASYDYYAKHLRLIDAQIQRANWETNLDVDEKAMEPFIDPYVIDPVKK